MRKRFIRELDAEVGKGIADGVDDLDEAGVGFFEAFDGGVEAFKGEL